MAAVRSHISLLAPQPEAEYQAERVKRFIRRVAKDLHVSPETFERWAERELLL